MHLAKKNEFPSGIFGAFIPVLLLLSIKKTAPENPIKIPIIFLRVTFSFKKKYESIRTKTGDKVIIIPLLIVVDNSRPLKKASIFTHIPNI